MAKAKTKTYIMLGRHWLADGTRFNPGDEIELTEAQAAGLVNKIREPGEPGLAPAGEDQSAEISRLQADKDSLESENKSLRDQLQKTAKALKEQQDSGGKPDEGKKSG